MPNDNALSLSRVVNAEMHRGAPPVMIAISYVTVLRSAASPPGVVEPFSRAEIKWRIYSLAAARVTQWVLKSWLMKTTVELSSILIEASCVICLEIWKVESSGTKEISSRWCRQCKSSFFSALCDVKRAFEWNFGKKKKEKQREQF